METISLIGKKVTVTHTTGKVLDTNKNMETKVTGRGGGGVTLAGYGGTRSVKIKSETIVHDQVFLEDKDGREHSFQLTGFHLSCRESNQLTVVFANNTPVTVINQSTNQVFHSNGALRSVGKLNPILALVAFALIAYFTVNSSNWGDSLLVLILGSAVVYWGIMMINASRIKSSINPSLYQ